MLTGRFKTALYYESVGGKIMKKFLCLRITVAVMVFMCACIFGYSVSAETVADQYTWRNVSLGGGGYITGLVFCEDGTVYARCDVGGVYKWNAAEKRWDALTEWITSNQSNLFGVDGIASENSNSNVVYAALGKYDTQQPHGLYKSTDGGKSWEQTAFKGVFGGNKDDRFRGEPIAINPFNNLEIMVASRDGLLQKSKDGGKTWESISDFPSKQFGKYTRVVAYDNKNAGTVYADIKDNGLYRSTDGGKTWESMDGVNAPKTINRIRVVNGTVFVAADNGVLKFENNEWKILNGYSLNGVTNFRALDVDENNTDRIICCFDDGIVKTEFDNLLFYTEDGGENWVNITDKSVKENTVKWWPSYYFSAHTSDIHFVGDKGVWLSDWYGVWKTEDLSAQNPVWINEIKGIENMVAFDLSCPSQGAPLIVGVADNCGMRVENIDIYPEEKLSNPLRNITSGIDFCEADPNIVARVATDSGDNGAIGISTDNGKSYSEYKPFTFSGGKIAVSATKNESGILSMVMVPVNDLPYYSWDMGKTWTKATFPNGTEPTFIDKIWKWNNVLQSDRVESDTFYLINPNNGKFYVSTNGGKTWSLRWERGSGKAAVRIKTAPGLKNTVFMSLANEGLVKSTDGGKTFEKVTNVDHASMIAFGKGIDDSVPALYLYGKTANEDGIFRSVDLGETWEKISNAQTAVGGEPNCMEGDRQTFGTVYIGTNGRGFYVGEEKKEEVIHVWYDDAGCTSGDHTGVDATGGYFILQAGTTNMNQTDVVYNGTKAIEVTGSTTYVKYNGYNGALANIATATEAIKTGNSYICGWFYTTGDNSHIKLVNTEQKIEKKNEWVFMYERIPANTTSVNAFFAERSEKAKLYVDDLKLVKVSDGSVPTPFKREITIPSQPDMYTKTLHTFYSDGELNAFQQHPHVTKHVDFANAEKMEDTDSKAIKMTGDLYLQPKKDGKAVTYGELSDEVKSAIEEGRAYLTFWQYINDVNLSETDAGYTEGVNFDLYFPGNVRTKGAWVWVKVPITNVNTNNIYFKCRNAYAWIDDLCITVFEDREEGIIENKYKLKVNGNTVTEGSEILPGQTLTVNAEYSNNTKKMETVLPIIATYGAGGKLEGINTGEAVSIIPFKSGMTEYSFKVPEDTGAEKIKVMLWSDLTKMKPVGDAREIIIK